MQTNPYGPPINLIIVESHDRYGVKWGVAKNPNSAEEEYVPCKSKAHARYVVEAAKKGYLVPMLEAAMGKPFRGEEIS